MIQARTPLGAVPPGRYTASVALESDGQPLARIGRVIEITPAPAIAETETAAVPPVEPLRRHLSRAGAAADDVMERVGGYVERYGGEASLLVGVEHYTQSVSVARVTGVLRGRSNAPTITSVSQVPGQKRQLVSEFALVPNASASGGWLGYRDVMEVDGKAVADRHDRLLALFQSEAPDLEAARRITDESARYNIGPVGEISTSRPPRSSSSIPATCRDSPSAARESSASRGLTPWRWSSARRGCRR